MKWDVRDGVEQGEKTNVTWRVREHGGTGDRVMSLTPQCFPCCSVDGLLLLAVSFKGMDGLANIWPSGEVSLSSRGFLPACHVRMLIIAKKKKKKKKKKV